MSTLTYTDITERLRTETPFYARNMLKIADKRGRIIDFDYSPAQLAFDEAIEDQRARGLGMRAIILKARQIGMSTAVQAKLIQRGTQRENYNSVVVAHDVETGGKLFKIGKRMYDHLPDDNAWKPDLAGRRRGREMHFLNGGHRARAGAWPDSTYLVDTAGEFQSGRGGTYQAVHASELAFWGDAYTKLTALKNAVPDHPESMFIIESTANGHNAFKELWDDAVAGESEYVPFFWPWWKEPEYSRAFENESERERFRIGDTSQSRFAADEPALVDPGPLDTMTNENVPLTLEQLNWRRKKIANESSGKVELFKQEYPATPEEAFIASARQVFDPALVSAVRIKCGLTDPRNPTPEHPGPKQGNFVARSVLRRPTPSGDTIVIPTHPGWQPAEKLTVGNTPNWKLWLPDEVDGDADLEPLTEGQYVIGVDVSGGEIEGERGEPAYHAIEVIDHKTRVQVAEYRSRIDPDLLATEVYLACLFFNKPWVAIEITGSWGMPVARKMWKDGFRYPYLHFRKKMDKKTVKSDDRLGWDTNRLTKPILEANTSQMLREETHGIKSAGLASELATYIRHPNGKSGPEPGKFSDRLMAWQICQQVAHEQPLKFTGSTPTPMRPRTPETGW